MPRIEPGAAGSGSQYTNRCAMPPPNVVIFFTGAASNLCHSGLVMQYTEEEELWLDQQHTVLDEAFFSISLGEDIIRVSNWF